MKPMFAVAAVLMITVSLVTANAFAKGGRRVVLVNEKTETLKPNTHHLWTIKAADEKSVTLVSKDQVKELKMSHFTDVVIDGQTKKPADITAGMKVLNFVQDGVSVSRLVLQSGNDKASDSEKGRNKK